MRAKSAEEMHIDIVQNVFQCVVVWVPHKNNHIINKFSIVFLFSFHPGKFMLAGRLQDFWVSNYLMDPMRKERRNEKWPRTAPPKPCSWEGFVGSDGCLVWMMLPCIVYRFMSLNVCPPTFA